MYKKIISAIFATIIFFSFVPSISFAIDRYQVLQIGDEDRWVFELQQMLNELDYLEVPATGYFGTDTQNAVVKYQNDHMLTVDGKAGPETRQAILGNRFTELPPDREVNLLYALPSLSAEEVSNSGNTLALGDKGTEIVALQKKLKEYEYYEYTSITGYYGPLTEEAVKKFQRTHDLVEDGIMGQDSLALLNSDAVKYYTMYPGDRGEDIAKMQLRLKELGYFNGEATGYYGDATLQAVKIFQDSNGLNADGKAGMNTRKLLYADDTLRINASASASTENQASDFLSRESVTAPSAPTATTAVEQTASTPDTSISAPVPTPTPQSTPAPTPQPTPAPVSANNSTGVARLLEVANSQIGKPYSYGSSGPSSFDCSGFVYYTMKNSGIGTGRLSSAGYASVSNWPTISDVGSLSVGDLVFFRSDSSSSISHMGIYLGGGSFIHAAPSSGGVAVSGMSSGYYSRNFVTAKRIF
jgi:peptidoglycan hydrolase-like protein with peptidoglycan-binding domain